jgi:hypothetical protein
VVRPASAAIEGKIQHVRAEAFKSTGEAAILHLAPVAIGRGERHEPQKWQQKISAREEQDINFFITYYRSIRPAEILHCKTYNAG